jgi:hypothetical protein
LAVAPARDPDVNRCGARLRLVTIAADHVPRSPAPRSIALVFLASVALSAASCAGDLDKPERFASVIARFRDGGASPGGSGGLLRDSGMPSSPIDAGTSNAAAPPACVAELFMKTCGTTGCHEQGSQTLDLNSDGVTARLLDQDSVSMLCSGRTYIDSSGGASLLLDKLTQQPPCGARMPLIGTLNMAQRTCLTDWVSSLGGATQ